jgi:hypothetical protein
MGATVAGLGGEVWRQLWEDRDRNSFWVEEQIRKAPAPSARGN